MNFFSTLSSNFWQSSYSIFPKEIILYEVFFSVKAKALGEESFWLLLAGFFGQADDGVTSMEPKPKENDGR